MPEHEASIGNDADQSIALQSHPGCIFLHFFTEAADSRSLKGSMEVFQLAVQVQVVRLGLGRCSPPEQKGS